MARNDLANGVLRVKTYAASAAATGQPTRFRVTKLAAGHASTLTCTCDGSAMTAAGGLEVVAPDTVEVSPTVATPRIFTAASAFSFSAKSLPSHRPVGAGDDNGRRA
eukprot:SAG11_NODE_1117_length_5798_cov_10.203194_8_plen_107_part_00